MARIKLDALAEELRAAGWNAEVVANGVVANHALGMTALGGMMCYELSIDPDEPDDQVEVQSLIYSRLNGETIPHRASWPLNEPLSSALAISSRHLSGKVCKVSGDAMALAHEYALAYFVWANRVGPCFSLRQRSIDKTLADAEVDLDAARNALIARHLTDQPAVPVDAIARLVAIEEARAAIDHAGAEWVDRYYAARNAIQPGDTATVRAWIQRISEEKGQG